VKSHVAIGRKPVAGGQSELFIMISNAQNKHGIKYPLLNNVQAVFTKLLHEGRTTVRAGDNSVIEFTFLLPMNLN
jgi:hypothetical protein